MSGQQLHGFLWAPWGQTNVSMAGGEDVISRPEWLDWVYVLNPPCKREGMVTLGRMGPEGVCVCCQDCLSNLRSIPCHRSQSQPQCCQGPGLADFRPGSLRECLPTRRQSVGVGGTGWVRARAPLGGGHSLIGTVVSQLLTGQNSLNCTLKTCVLSLINFTSKWLKNIRKQAEKSFGFILWFGRMK